MGPLGAAIVEFHDIVYRDAKRSGDVAAAAAARRGDGLAARDRAA